jgi:hypothetical protein
MLVSVILLCAVKRHSENGILGLVIWKRGRMGSSLPEAPSDMRGVVPCSWGCCTWVPN